MPNWKTDEQKKVEGTFRSDREIGSSTKSTLLEKAPTPDKTYRFNKVGKAQFKKICQILIEEKRLTAADIPLITSMAKHYEIYFRAIDELEDQELFTEYTNKGGSTNRVYSPAIAIYTKMDDLIIKYCTQLGITPYTRSRLNIIPQTGDSPEDEFLKASKMP